MVFEVREYTEAPRASVNGEVAWAMEMRTASGQLGWKPGAGLVDWDVATVTVDDEVCALSRRLAYRQSNS